MASTRKNRQRSRQQKREDLGLVEEGPPLLDHAVKRKNEQESVEASTWKKKGPVSVVEASSAVASLDRWEGGRGGDESPSRDPRTLELRAEYEETGDARSRKGKGSEETDANLSDKSVQSNSRGAWCREASEAVDHKVESELNCSSCLKDQDGINGAVKISSRKSSTSNSKRWDKDKEAEVEHCRAHCPDDSFFESERKRVKLVDAGVCSSPKTEKRDECHRQRNSEESQKSKRPEEKIKSCTRDEPAMDNRKNFLVESEKPDIGIECSIQDDHRNLELEKELQNRIRRRKEESSDRGRRKDDDKEREGKRHYHQKVQCQKGVKYRDDSRCREEKHKDEHHRDGNFKEDKLKDEKAERGSRNLEEKDSGLRYATDRITREKGKEVKPKDHDGDDKDRNSKRHYHQRETLQRAEKYREDVKHRDDKHREEYWREGKTIEGKVKDEKLEIDSRNRDDRDRVVRHTDDKYIYRKDEKQRKEKDREERRKEAYRRSPSQQCYEERPKQEILNDEKLMIDRKHKEEKDTDVKRADQKGAWEEEEESQKAVKDRDERRRDVSHRSPSQSLLNTRNKEERGPLKMRRLEEMPREKVDRMQHSVHMNWPPGNNMVRPQMAGISNHPSGPSGLLPPPPPLRPGIDNPDVVGTSSSFDEGMGQRESGRYERKSGAPYKRSELGGPSGPSESWRGPRMNNWNAPNQGPVPGNMFAPFPPQASLHPPPGAFMGLGQQFLVPGIFGTARPSSELGFPVNRFSMGDHGGGFPGHGPVLGWHRPRELDYPQLPLDVWEGRGPYERYGRQEWDQAQGTQRLNGRSWEHGHDGWQGHAMETGRGFRTTQFHEVQFQPPLRVVEGTLSLSHEPQVGVKERWSVGIQEIRDLHGVSSAPPLDSNLSTQSSSSEGLNNSKPRKRATEKMQILLTNLDVSAEMAGAELYKQYLNLLPAGEGKTGLSTISYDDTLFDPTDDDLEFEVDTEAEALFSDPEIYSLFLTSIQDSVFKTAMDAYHRPQQEGRVQKSAVGSFVLPSASFFAIADKIDVAVRNNIPHDLEGPKELATFEQGNREYLAVLEVNAFKSSSNDIDNVAAYTDSVCKDLGTAEESKPRVCMGEIENPETPRGVGESAEASWDVCRNSEDLMEVNVLHREISVASSYACRSSKQQALDNKDADVNTVVTINGMLENGISGPSESETVMIETVNTVVIMEKKKVQSDDTAACADCTILNAVSSSDAGLSSNLSLECEVIERPVLEGYQMKESSQSLLGGQISSDKALEGFDKVYTVLSATVEEFEVDEVIGKLKPHPRSQEACGSTR